MRLLLILVLCSATSALAVSKGEKLYIRSKHAKLLKQPNRTAVALTTMTQGTEVIWNGPSEKDKLWHEVTVDGKRGFVRQEDLTHLRPQQELDSSTGLPMSREAFQSAPVSKPPFAGAASRTKGNPTDELAEAELIYLEELNKAKASPASVEEKHKELQGR